MHNIIKIGLCHSFNFHLPINVIFLIFVRSQITKKSRTSALESTHVSEGL